MTLSVSDNLLHPQARHGHELLFSKALYSTGISEEQSSGGVLREKIQSIRVRRSSYKDGLKESG